MLPLDVSFGIFILHPLGWLFMAIVIFGEAFLMSRYLTHKNHDSRVYLSAVSSNAVSGIIGIIISMILTGGWWLVVWFPWVSSNEVDIHDPIQWKVLVIYYLAALVLSILIELLINYLILKKRYTFKSVFNATLKANGFSYALGAIVIALLVCLL